MSGLTTHVALFSLLSAQAFAHPQANFPWKPSHHHASLHHHHHAHGTGYNPGSAAANSTGLFPYTHQTTTSTLLATVSPVPVNSEVVASDSSCATEGETVTETSTNIVTVTITPGGSSAVSAAATESSAAASSEETSASAAASTYASVPQKATPYHGPQTASSSAQSVAESSVESSSTVVAADSKAPIFAPTSASTFEAATSSVEAASSTVAPSSSAVASSSSSSTLAQSSSVPSFKRGVAYNVSSMVTPFEGDAQWGYNWVTSANGLDTSKFDYIPTLKDASGYWTSLWDAAVKAASPKTIFTFNEPDNAGQANMAVSQCVSEFNTWIKPYFGSMEIVAPSVTNSQSQNQGLDYLDQFLSGCDGCQIDAINLHWYDSYENAQGLIDYVGNASQQMYNNHPNFAGANKDTKTFTTYVTEFGFTDGINHNDGQYHPASDEQQAQALKTVLPYFDSQDFVKRYSYFMVYDGLMVSGDSVTQSGGVFQKYTAPYNG
ncbi:MAG: hypothetical protein M1821_002205 [Bathelium mastoideum]|nr:MAG: hypothetical protein M1821_002205 [Bathelium mastoideum]KAI9685083.1 MAG: hypothetical protein M1822_005475 [Bathelium mastoideum]